MNSPARPPLKVFLVEDNQDTLSMLAQLLRDDGYDVCTARTKQDALRELPSFGGQVLVSDLGLPDGSGWELLNELRLAGVRPYAIAMSGFGTLADFAASREAGFRNHLVKPIEIDALERLLELAREEIEAAS